jgi:hypothetical protein
VSSIGVAQTNSGGMVFVYNNFQSSGTANVNANTNAVLSTPMLQGWDVQTAKSMSGRVPGGNSYHAGGNSTMVGNGNTNAVACLVGGEIGLAFAQMGFTKGMGVLCNFGVNGTTNSQIELTNSQVNTNAYYGDTTLATCYAAVFQNLNNIDGVSSGNANIYVNPCVANGVGSPGINSNTNGNYSYTISANGGMIALQFPQGITINAASSQLLIAPANGGVFAAAFYGS